MSIKKRLDDLERAATHLDDDGGVVIEWVGEDGSVERIPARRPDEPIDYRRCLPATP